MSLDRGCAIYEQRMGCSRADEHMQKGKAPKDMISADYDPGHKANNLMTVIARC